VAFVWLTDPIIWRQRERVQQQVRQPEQQRQRRERPEQQKRQLQGQRREPEREREPGLLFCRKQPEQQPGERPAGAIFSF
jgi:hypothetical protein